MCFICDGGTHDEYDLIVEANIKRVGWHLTAVEATSRSPGWVYSIGLLESFDHPELVVMGSCCMECGGAQLNDLARLIEAGSRFAPGTAACDGHAGGPARFGSVHAAQWESDRFATWVNYYGPRGLPVQPAAVQVISRDVAGRWQDETPEWRNLRLDRLPARHRHSR